VSDPLTLSEDDVLAIRLRAAADAYYNGEPIMTDAEYDALEEQLRQLDPDHPLLSEVGAKPATSSVWPKVKHPFNMGSLEKVQTPDEMDSWINARVPTGVGVIPTLSVTDKLDGISILLTYTDGLLVRAATRGDGQMGEDITRNVKVMQGVPSQIALAEGTFHVRGEIVCLKEDFKAHFPNAVNPRNIASGVAKRKTGWDDCKHLTVIAYNMTGDPELVGGTRPANLNMLSTYGFKIPNVVTCYGADEVRDLYESYNSGVRDSLPYEIDGLVVEFSDFATQIRLGTTPDGMRPKGAVAFKFPHDMKEARLTDIVWQTGPTGRITPVAEFEPVVLAGATVSRASLHNPDYIKDVSDGQGFRRGDIIRVSRRNDVIPAVEELVFHVGTDEYVADIPHQCPSCGTGTHRDGAYLVCPNEDGCPAQVFGGIRRWIRKIGVKHFGDQMVQAAVESGLVKGIPDLYRISEGDLAALTTADGSRIGGSAKRALDSLHSLKTLPLDVFVGSLGIPLCGRRMVSMLMAEGMDTLSALADAAVSDLARTSGWGETKAEAFRAGFDQRAGLIFELHTVGVTVAPPEPRAAPSKDTGPLDGMSVCFTGFRDKSLEALVVGLGGKIASGVSRNTTHLVVKDTSTSSSKATKARKLGIPIMLPDQLKGHIHELVGAP